MRKLLLTYVLLIFTLICNAQAQESYRRIGYTTTYGNTFSTQTISNTNFQSVNIHKNNPVIQSGNYTSGLYKVNPSYKPVTSCGKPGIKKSPQRPYSGNILEDLADWWRINTDANWPSYVDDDYWETFLAENPGYEEEVREWFEEHGQKFPGDPEDPYPTPIGNSFVLIIFLFIWVIYKHLKNGRLHRTV